MLTNYQVTSKTTYDAHHLADSERLLEDVAKVRAANAFL